MGDGCSALRYRYYFLLAFGHVPDGWAALGMGMIALCGVAGAWLTLTEHRQRARLT